MTARGTSPPRTFRRAQSTARSVAQTAWCGAGAQADRAPNAVAGNPIHWVYVIPSDGADNLSGLASVMQSDAEQIDGWWRGQDPTRTPRNDVAPFSCGAQLDVTTVRTPQSSAQLAPLQGRFSGIVDALDQAGLSSSTTKYVVYYDGPTADEERVRSGRKRLERLRRCGRLLPRVRRRLDGGGDRARGAAHVRRGLERGARTNATARSSGHTCDDEADLMFPSIGGEPLSSKVLDPGRDDYYGHAGGWTDTQDSAWLVRLDSQAPLALTVSGPGSVSADVPGLLCAASCTTTWNAGQRLALRATPSAGARLVRWAGACSGAAGCVLSVTPGAAVTAVFAAGVLPADGRRHREGSRAELAGGDHVPAALLCGVPVVQPRAPDGDAGEGLEVPLVERRLPRREEDLHGADERGHERPRHLRSRLNVQRGRAESIR